jgi:hypothetical protein
MRNRLFLSVIVIASLQVQPAGAERNAEILQVAGNNTGKKMWYGYGLSSGLLGCAAALSNVLNKAGYKQAKSAAVRTLYQQLRTTRGAKDFTLAGTGKDVTAAVLAASTKPGDVLLAFRESPDKANLGPDAHCGIVGPNGDIYTNDWNDGIWKLSNFQKYFYYYKHFRIVRLP